MLVHLTKSPGLANELLCRIPVAEIDDALLHIANRDQFMTLPGRLRHDHSDKALLGRLSPLKTGVQHHLHDLTLNGKVLLSDDGAPLRRLIAIGARNLGNNHGVVAWQREQSPRFFSISGDPLNYPEYWCVVKGIEKRLSMRGVRFENALIYAAGRNITDEVDWCVSGSPILRAGRVVPVEDVIEQFYDIRHILAFVEESPEGKHIKEEIYKDYPVGFRENALRALHELGVPRQRFLHNCLGLAEKELIILQKEGTIEEVAAGLKAEGASDGLILDNGGSVFCWAWWPYPNGGFIYSAPDFRPGSSAIIAFVLRGPARTVLPGGSVGFTVL
jgi:hypothetical protein